MEHELTCLLKTLKTTMRAKGHTYATLAKELNVSEVTLKRTFTGHPTPLDRIFAICQALGVSFFDVTASAQRSAEEDYFLNSTQDDFFASHPAYYALFIDLYRRENPKRVREHWNLSEKDFFKVLRRLESLELLDVLPGNQFRFRMRGPVRVPKNGKLSRLILKKQSAHFLDRALGQIEETDVILQTSEVLMSAASCERLHADLMELGRKYRGISLQDETLLPKTKLKSVRWLLAFAPYRTDWREFKLDAH